MAVSSSPMSRAMPPACPQRKHQSRVHRPRKAVEPPDMGDAYDHRRRDGALEA